MRPGRTAADGHLEALNGVCVPFGKNLDTSVVLVTHVAANVFALSRIFDEQAEPDPLHPAFHDILPSDEHERLYRCEGVR